MKNYDDLQRFKEKTQTLDIAFKDMSGQTQEAAEHSKWALIRQLAKEEHQTPLGGGQRIDLPQPQPLRGDEFSASPSPTVRQAAPEAQPAHAARSSLLDSLANSSPQAERVAKSGPSSLFPPPPPAPPVADAALTQQPAHAADLPSAGAPVQPAPAADLQTASGTQPGRFGALFRSRDSEPVSLSKETLLKPLLEKIALCR